MERDVQLALQLGAPGLLKRWEALVDEAAGSGEDPQRPASLGGLQRLRERYGASVARFVSLQSELTGRAATDEPLVFRTRKGAEQATAQAVARRRAQRFSVAARGHPSAIPPGTPSCAPCGSLIAWDATSGIGADAVALAGALPLVVVSDREAESLRCAAANLQVRREREDATQGRTLAIAADALVPPFADTRRVLALFDPDRRPEGRRDARPEYWSPPLPSLLRRAHGFAGVALKLSPSTDAETVLAYTPDPGAAPLVEPLMEWVSLDGEMKELTVYTGALASGERGPDERTAVALRGASSAAEYYGRPSAMPAETPTESILPGRQLVELDVSLWQAGLAESFADDFGLAPLPGAGVRGYFLADAVAGEAPHKRLPQGLARSWRIVAVSPGDRKQVRKMLRSEDIGPLTVKKRNHPSTAEELAKKFRGPGSKPGLLAVTRLSRGSVALLLEAEP